MRSPNKLLIGQAFTGKQLAGDGAHLVYCIQAPEVVAAGKLLDVPVQVFGGHVMVDAVVSPL